MKYFLFIYLLTFTILSNSCLKARKSVIDINKNSSTMSSTAFLVGNIKTTSDETTNSSTSVAPTNISYGSSNIVRLIPGVTISYIPTVTGNVESWTISPSLPDGLVFDSINGKISGSPNLSYLATGFPLTIFKITAKNGTAAQDFSLQIQILATGENVWTVFSGEIGGNTLASSNSLRYESVSNSLYVVGNTNVNLHGNTIPSTGGNSSGFLSKYDLNGNRLWTKIFGVSGGSGTGASGIVFDGSGNIYIAGTAYTGTINGLSITSPYAAFVIKYDTNGNMIWINSSLPSKRHSAGGLTIDNSGNINLVTIVNDTALHQTNLSWTDAGLSIVKYDGSSGAYITSVMISSNSGTPFLYGLEAQAIAADTTGNLFVAAAVRSSAYCGTSTSFYNPVLLRFDSNLNYLGCTGLSSPGSHSFPFSVSVDASGVYISGYAYSNTFDGITRTGISDGYFTKFSTTGVKQWTRMLGVAGKDTATNSVGFSSGYLYVSGMTTGNYGGKIINGQQDMFVAKYDTNGNQIWIKLQGIENDSSPCAGAGCTSSIAFDANNTLYTFSSTNGKFGTITNPATPSNISLFLVRNVQ